MGTVGEGNVGSGGSRVDDDNGWQCGCKWSVLEQGKDKQGIDDKGLVAKHGCRETTVVGHQTGSNGRDNDSRGGEEDEEVEGGGNSEIGVSGKTLLVCGRELSVGATIAILPTEEEAG
ncbi:hypothetical protein BHM03_00057935 [Ensete ventricosum]|nr:hypothetical protein BHM03_00057935 [Ensete ventricosum]